MLSLMTLGGHPSFSHIFEEIAVLGHYGESIAPCAVPDLVVPGVDFMASVDVFGPRVVRFEVSNQPVGQHTVYQQFHAALIWQQCLPVSVQTVCRCSYRSQEVI